jgi:uncharacterized RDD family membrane protein YckC
MVRRLAAMAYEFLLLAAVLFLAGYVHLALFGEPDTPFEHALLQAWLFAVIGAYFTWLWSRGGQTLALKTWRMRIVDMDGAKLSSKRAALRYLLAWVSLAPFGLGFAWALFDRDRQYLHDRLLGTRLIDTRDAR